MGMTSLFLRGFVILGLFLMLAAGFTSASCHRPSGRQKVDGNGKTSLNGAAMELSGDYESGLQAGAKNIPLITMPKPGDDEPDCGRRAAPVLAKNALSDSRPLESLPTSRNTAEEGKSDADAQAGRNDVQQLLQLMRTLLHIVKEVFTCTGRESHDEGAKAKRSCAVCLKPGPQRSDATLCHMCEEAEPSLKYLGTTPYHLLAEYYWGGDYGLLARHRDDHTCLVAFRATVGVSQLVGSVGALYGKHKKFKTDKSTGQLMTYGHTGFLNAYERLTLTSNDKGQPAYSEFIQDLRECLGDHRRLLITGHSRGGGLANLLAVQLMLDDALESDDEGNHRYNFTRFRDPNSQDLSIWTFAEPRTISVGDDSRGKEETDLVMSNFRKLQVMLKRKMRVVNGQDPVAAMPPWDHYQHIGTPVWLHDGKMDVLADLKASNFPAEATQSLAFKNAKEHYLDAYVDSINQYERSMLPAREHIIANASCNWMGA